MLLLARNLLRRFRRCFAIFSQRSPSHHRKKQSSLCETHSIGSGMQIAMRRKPVA